MKLTSQVRTFDSNQIVSLTAKLELKYGSVGRKNYNITLSIKIFYFQQNKTLMHKQSEKKYLFIIK